MTKQQLLKQSEVHLREMLVTNLPQQVHVYLFGSRARGDARWNSDFDLWVDGDIPPAVLHDIEDQIEESFIPFHVDFVTTPQLAGRFGEIVRKEAKLWM